MTESQLDIRVRYNECDPMGLVHHSIYPVWFEMGRTELLRGSAKGITYRDLESQQVFLAVVSLEVKYKRPARYDDQLVLLTRLTQVGHAKIEHEYELKRDGLLLTIGRTVIACLDKEGRPRPVPEVLRPEAR